MSAPTVPTVQHTQPLANGNTVRAVNLFNSPTKVIAWIERPTGFIERSATVTVDNWPTHASRLLCVPITLTEATA